MMTALQIFAMQIYLALTDGLSDSEILRLAPLVTLSSLPGDLAYREDALTDAKLAELDTEESLDGRLIITVDGKFEFARADVRVLGSGSIGAPPSEVVDIHISLMQGSYFGYARQSGWYAAVGYENVSSGWIESIEKLLEVLRRDMRTSLS